MYIYIASSWRNPFYDPFRDDLLHRYGSAHVYDFKAANFHWSNVGIDSTSDILLPNFLSSLSLDPVRDHAHRDYSALERSTHLILILECGKSAHLELGYAIGQHKKTAILSPLGHFTPELMYFPVDLITQSGKVLFNWLDLDA